jgi:PKD repeat protein
MKRIYTLLILVVALLMTYQNDVKAQSYCTPTWTNSGSNWQMGFVLVQIGSINNSSGTPTTTQPYNNYTNLSTSHLRGTSVNYTIQIGPSYGQWCCIWIDFNNDGDFTTSGDLVAQMQTSTGGYTFTGSFTVSGSAPAGAHRMRLMTEYYGMSAYPSSCGPVNYAGECEDYTFVVVSPYALDAKVNAIVNPGPTSMVDTGVATPIRVDIKNAGTSVLTSCTVNWDVDGVTQTPYAWTGSRASDSIAKNIQIGTKSFTPGTHVIRAWTSNPNGGTDQDATNDMATYSFCTAERSKLGTYTIGPGGDFQTFAAALSMMNCGILGPVVFNVLPYTFSERVVIGPVKGASATNTVTFRGTNKSNSVLTYAGASSNPRATVVLNGCKYINFENMSITNTGSSYANCVFFTAQAEYNKITNCKLQVNNTYTSSYVCPVEAGSAEGSWGGAGNNANYNTVQGCDILGGYYGIYFMGTSTTVLCLGNKFSNNTFRDQYYSSIYSYYQRDLLVQRNNIDIGSRYTSNYGIISYYNQRTSIDGNIVKPGLYGIYTYYENYYATSDSSWVINNMINGFKTTTQQIGLYSYYNYNMRVYHNNIRVNGTLQNNYSNTALLFYYTYNAKVKNNILYCESGKGSLLLTFYPYPYSTSYVDYNDYYYVGCTTNMFYNNSLYVTDFNAWKASVYNISSPHDVNSFNFIDPNFVSTNDLHLQNRFSPLKGKNVGVMTDRDGDARCLFEVTLGADESAASYSKPKAGFISEDTVCLGSPVTFINNAGPTEPKAHKWYVNKVLRASTLSFTYTFQNTGKDTVMLITTSCGGADTFTKVIFVGTPSGKPKANFVTDVNIVETYWPVYLRDLSSGCPDAWEWSVSPPMNANSQVTFEFILGTSNTSQNPTVWFYEPGKYKVCLKAFNNANGTVDSTCIEDYIIVKSLGVMCQGNNYDNSPYGVLYDDVQGPTYIGPVSRTYCGYTISTCSDSLVLTFRKFDVSGNDYVRIYQGIDNTGIALYDKIFWPKGPGHNVNINSPGFQKSYVSKTGKMYIEWERAAGRNGATVNLEGFEAEWIAYTDSFPSPKADFNYDDTVCMNMKVNFQNISKGGYGDPTYFWDFDSPNNNDVSSYKDGTMIYTSKGKYHVKLKITDCGGSDSIIKDIVVVQPSISPTPAFSASILKPFANSDNVTLIDESFKCVDNWSWSITPNTYSLVGASTLTDQNPVVKFIDTGCYSIQLIAGYGSHTATLTKSCYIRAINYCKPSAINLSQDVGISRVKVGTIDNYSSIGTSSYSDYTLSQSTFLELQSTYDLTVQRNTVYNASNRKVWIDYNIDGDFDDAGELVASESNTSTISWTTNFTVPATVTLGATRMRIGTTLATFPTNPCGTTPYGEFEDYRIILRIDKTPPVITLLGAPTVNIDQCTASYTDASATAWDNVDHDVTSKIVPTNNVNLSKTGSYWYHYDVVDAHGNVAITGERVINVVPEKVNPIISLKGNVWDTASLFLPYIDPGYNVSDACSGIKNVVVNGTVNTNEVGSYTLTYTAYDSAGNHSAVVRNVIVLDNVDPEIKLIGSGSITLLVHKPYIEQGAVVTDNYCTNLLPKITGSVDVHRVGTYILTYTAIDCNGNGPVSVTRTIEVIDTVSPIITYTGPSSYTIEVFDRFIMPFFSIKDNYCTDVTVKNQGSFYTTFPNEKATTLGDYVAEYEATDCMGNKSKFSVIIHVVDTEKPVITMQGPAVINICRYADINPADDVVTVSDNYDNIAASTVTKTGSYFSEYLIKRKEGFYSITYNVSDKSSNKALSVSRYISVVDCKLSVKEGLNNYVKVYPNPNNGQFVLNVQLPATNNITIIITNTLGQIVKQMNEINSSGNTYQLDLGSFGSGLYMIKVSTDNESTVFPVSVTR